MRNITVILALIAFSLFAQLPHPIRAVWLTNVDSDVLTSHENICEAVKNCSDWKINTIAVVVWNKGKTMFPSETMYNFFDIRIDSIYGDRDPLKELIAEAHKKKIKVIAWFEFGFSSSYKSNGGHLLSKHPEWAAKDTNGALVTKNGFEWMNGFHPDVQDFMLSLISEVVKNYDVDGIQGDDRLPAMPVESGYDAYTINQYKRSHSGKEPPRNCKDPEWIQWRADEMTRFCERIYAKVKSIKKNVAITMSPSIYPWSKDEYLQDWPSWVKMGCVDVVFPQLYRYKIEDYQKCLNAIVTTQLTKKQLKKFYPGILLKVGSYVAEESLLNECIKANRAAGINGECFFFYEGLKQRYSFFKTLYKKN